MCSQVWGPLVWGPLEKGPSFPASLHPLPPQAHSLSLEGATGSGVQRSATSVGRQSPGYRSAPSTGTTLFITLREQATQPRPWDK